MGIRMEIDHQKNYNCFTELFAVSPYKSLYLHMHGLIFETSIWLLAGSTRLLKDETNKNRSFYQPVTSSAEQPTKSVKKHLSEKLQEQRADKPILQVCQTPTFIRATAPFTRISSRVGIAAPQIPHKYCFAYLLTQGRFSDRNVNTHYHSNTYL